MSSFPVSTSHNIASSCGSDHDFELGYVNPSEEQSELVASVERRDHTTRSQNHATDQAAARSARPAASSSCSISPPFGAKSD
jgi:hypothetical protein